MRISHPSTLAAVACLCACSVGPSFVEPQPALPAEWSQQSAIASEPVDEQWWKSFDDPLLIELVSQAREANPDVQTAALRVAQSRAQRAIVAGSSVPNVAAKASYQRQRQSEFGTATRMIDAIAPPSGRDAIVDVLSDPYDLYQVGFDASWEIDLWGRSRNAIKAADASVAASTEDLHAAQLSVTAEVARTYFDLRGVNDQLRIANEDVAAAEDALELTEVRANGGTVTQLDVVSHRVRLADARARRPVLQQRQTQLRNNLALLLGEPPDALPEAVLESRSAVKHPPKVAAGLPSEVARRRPDIRAAEARLEAATAEIGVAVADLYPRITLTGGLMSESLQASNLTEWGARQWSVGPSLYLPIFEGGRRRSMVELRELQQQEAAIHYQRTVLRAWHEIDSALSAYESERQHHDELLAAVDASRDAYELAKMRYEHGMTSFLIALDAQRTLLQTQSALTDSSTALSTHLIALYKALGAGYRSVER